MFLLFFFSRRVGINNQPTKSGVVGGIVVGPAQQKDTLVHPGFLVHIGQIHRHDLRQREEQPLEVERRRRLAQLGDTDQGAAVGQPRRRLVQSAESTFGMSRRLVGAVFELDVLTQGSRTEGALLENVRWQLFNSLGGDPVPGYPGTTIAHVANFGVPRHGPTTLHSVNFKIECTCIAHRDGSRHRVAFRGRSTKSQQVREAITVRKSSTGSTARMHATPSLTKARDHDRGTSGVNPPRLAEYVHHIE